MNLTNLFFDKHPFLLLLFKMNLLHLKDLLRLRINDHCHYVAVFPLPDRIPVQRIGAYVGFTLLLFPVRVQHGALQRAEAGAQHVVVHIVADNA